jgi:hypothetical protein
LREGKWLKLADLPQVAYTLQEQPPAIIANPIIANPIIANPIIANPIIANPIIASPKDGPTIKIKRMPTAKATAAQKKALPPVHQFTIIANVLEPAEPAIEVTSVRRVKPLKVDGTDYWLCDNKVYERRPNGSYVGRWSDSSIDKEVPDSDEE